MNCRACMAKSLRDHELGIDPYDEHLADRLQREGWWTIGRLGALLMIAPDGSGLIYGVGPEEICLAPKQKAIAGILRRYAKAEADGKEQKFTVQTQIMMDVMYRAVSIAMRGEWGYSLKDALGADVNIPLNQEPVDSWLGWISDEQPEEGEDNEKRCPKPDVEPE